ncbi:BamA/TamA family outer membrane protein [Salinisphaera sp. USBA-960]|nr:BamA/TamA family outer membrane protein [Salifodinibacter halophilus]NNC26191.1 BamA/TamA family outer membrane protein [Salifodinibacter halophilus]
MRFLSCLLATVALCIGAISFGAHAGPNRELSRHLGRIMIIDNEKRYVRHHDVVMPPDNGVMPTDEPEAPASVGSKSSSAVLPQIGYNPSDGIILGVKYSVVGFGNGNRTLDLGATQSSGGNTSFNLSFGTPHLLGAKRWIGLAQFGYQLAPSRHFYGLGNNGAGPAALSTHERMSQKALFMLGYRLAPHWVAAVDAGFNKVRISRGSRDGSKPRTVNEFSNLPDVHGGTNSPVSVSLFYNTQRDLTRPMRGWNNVFKVQHVGSELGNNVKYTRYLADIKYTHPLFSRKNILGFRLNGSYVDGSGDDLPFYELASLGGGANLEGFSLDRFRGQSRVFVQTGLRRKLADFNFHNIWRVRLDGAVFGGAGRVFLDKSKLPNDLSRSVYPGLDNEIQYSGGAGLRIALGEALIARADVGFSKESQGLFYLTFGNRF